MYNWRPASSHGDEKYRLLDSETGAQLFAMEDRDSEEEHCYDVYLRPGRFGPAYKVEEDQVADVLNGEFDEVLPDYLEDGDDL